jgi:hypothetical protein
VLTIPDLPTAPDTVELEACWRASDRVAGFSRFEAYDSDLGGLAYIARHEATFREENIACPRLNRCRRKGCVVAPSRWD